MGTQLRPVPPNVRLKRTRAQRDASTRGPASSNTACAPTVFNVHRGQSEPAKDGSWQKGFLAERARRQSPATSVLEKRRDDACSGRGLRRWVVVVPSFPSMSTFRISTENRSRSQVHPRLWHPGKAFSKLPVRVRPRGGMPKDLQGTTS